MTAAAMQMPEKNVCGRIGFVGIPESDLPADGENLKRSRRVVRHC